MHTASLGDNLPEMSMPVIFYCDGEKSLYLVNFKSAITVDLENVPVCIFQLSCTVMEKSCTLTDLPI